MTGNIFKPGFTDPKPSGSEAASRGWAVIRVSRSYPWSIVLVVADGWGFRPLEESKLLRSLNIFAAYLGTRYASKEKIILGGRLATHQLSILFTVDSNESLKFCPAITGCLTRTKLAHRT